MDSTHALYEVLGNNALKLFAYLYPLDEDINVADMMEISGMSRKTVDKYVVIFRDYGILKLTRLVGVSPMYKIDKHNAIVVRLRHISHFIAEEQEKWR